MGAEADSTTAMTTRDPGVNPPDPDEAVIIQSIADLTASTVRRQYPRGSLARRDAHPKHHAIVRAEFRVDEVPADLRHGIFAAPGMYPAWIRFSNGSPTPNPDARKDQRGMAIKLLDVPGPKMLSGESNGRTQDFVLASAPCFFIRNVRDYVQFTHAATSNSKLRLLAYFFRGLPWHWRLHELGALNRSLHHAEDMLVLRYWSQTPYRLGPHIVKYSARPIRPLAPETAGAGTPDYLRERLAVRLAREAVTYEFLVQRRTDPAAMPVDDATIEWDEARAPFERVATIVIPVQRFDSSAQMTMAEQISYTPWHTRPEHEPVGVVNRTRRVVYETVSALRHELNGTMQCEPVSLDPEEYARHVSAPAARKEGI
jgi:hypothetical protein